MAVLAVAGLLRPEAWVLAGAYWLWCGWRRIDLLVLAAAAPLVWALVDLWVTGDPLFSLHATSDLADELNRNRGLSSVPGSFVSFVTDTARPPVALAGAAGALLLWRLRQGRALHVPIALFGAGVVTFLATGLAGLSVLPRYLTIPVVAVCLLAGYGVLGFTTLPAGRVRQAVVAGGDRRGRARARLRGRSRRPSSARCAVSCASSGAPTTTSWPSSTRPRCSATCAAAR